MKKNTKGEKIDYQEICKENYYISTTDDMLQLMDIYLREWEHRDSILWDQSFRFFVAALVVMILPFSNFKFI